MMENVLIDQLNKRIDSLTDLMTERFANAKEQVANALESSNRAIQKADLATEKRFEGVNEFRAALTDQNREFVRQVEYDTGHANLTDKVDVLSASVISVESTVRNRIGSTPSGPVFLISVISVMGAIIIALVSGAIQLGAIQTHVLINSANIEKLQTGEAARIVEHAGENVVRGNLEARQDLTDDRIKRLETNSNVKPPDVAALVERIAKLEIEVKNGLPNR